MSQESLTRECELLRKELQTVTQIKNNIILELQRSLSKADHLNRKHEERILQLATELRVLKDKNRELETFSRERSHAITHKNIRIAQLETELEERVAKEAEKWRGEVEAQHLRTVVAEQEAELAHFLEDHHNYLHEIERLQQPYHYLHAERALLLDFNQELQNQVRQAEEAGVQLEQWAVAAREELQHQNEQANDLLGQVEYMVEQVPR